MARRVHIFSVLSSIAFLIAVFAGSTVFAQPFNTTFNRYSVRDLNIKFNDVQVAGNPRTQQDVIIAGDNVTLTINSPDGVLMDTEAMYGKIPVVNFRLLIDKNGAGNWRLGDGRGYLEYPDDITSNVIYGLGNVLNAGSGVNTFNVNAGILDLMRGTTIQTIGGTGSAFTVFSGADVNARGANTITPSGGLVLENNSSLGFDLTHYVESDFDKTAPILTITGNVTAPGGGVAINLLGFSEMLTPTPIALLRYNYTPVTQQGNTVPDPPPIFIGSTTAAANANLQVRGEVWSTVAANSRLSDGTYRLSGEFTQSPAGSPATISLNNAYSRIGIVSWRGSTAPDGQTWNATASNWTGMDGANLHTFLHGDTVRFINDPSVVNMNITVQSGGVQIGGWRTVQLPNGQTTMVAGTMEVLGGNYSFTNDANSTIGIDGQGKVIVDGQSTFAAFNSANSYWGGTEIRNRGTLIARNAKALGTGLVQMYSGGVLIFDIDAPPPDSIVSNNISGEAGTTIVKEGTGNVHLDGIVTSSGDTEVREGILTNNIGTGVLTVYYGATYDADDQNRVVAGVSDGPAGTQATGEVFPEPNGGNIVMGTGNLLLNVTPGKIPTYTRDYPDTAKGYLSFSGTIDGAGMLVKYGDGDQILSENPINVVNGIFSTYSGGTEINKGKLVVQHVMDDDREIHTLGTGIVTIDSVGTLQFDIAGDANALNPTDLVAIFTNSISGEGTVLKMACPDFDSPRSDSCVLYLTASDSNYTGLTDVREGALRLGSVNSTGKTCEVQLAKDAALQFNISAPDIYSSLEFRKDADGRPLYGQTPYDRIITGAGNVEVMPDSLAVVSGTNAAQSDRSNYTGTTTIWDNATLCLVDVDATGRTSQVLLATPTSQLFLDFDQDQTYDRYITGFGNLTKRGAGVTTLNYDPDKFFINPVTGKREPVYQPNDYTGSTHIYDGTLRLLYAQATGIDDAPGDQSVEVRGGILELAFHGDYYKGIWGTGAIAKSGTNTVTTLKGLSTYEGGTYIYGTKNVDGTFSLGGTLSFNDTSLQAGNLGQGGIFFQRGGGTLRNTAANPTFDQKVEIDAGSTAVFETFDDMTILGSNGISHRVVDTDDPNYNAADLRSHFEKRGVSDLTILTAAGWTGRTVVREGRLIGNIPKDTELTVDASGEYHAGNDHRRVSLLLGEGVVQTTQGLDFIVNNAVEDVFVGAIHGFGNLVKSGQGLFLLEGTENDYYGKTVVQEGVLRGNISSNTALVVEGKGTYESGNADRGIRSLEGSGNVDMQNASLSIYMFDPGQTAVFNGQILNGRRLQKAGPGTQILGGKYYEFLDDVLVTEGTLQIGESSSATSVFKTGGNLTISPNGTFAINPLAQVDVAKKLTVDGTFAVSVGHNNIVYANEVTLGEDSTINITGITSATETRTIILSNSDIVGQFKNVTVAGNPSTNVDFLIFGVSYDDPKAIKVGQSLRWYSGTDAHGTFTLDNPDGFYDAGVSLRDITDASRRDPAWDGKTLTKKGLGMLVLSASNTYTGETRVQEGTLKLTHAEATLGSSRIVLGTTTIPNVGALELDFNGSMATSITGTGSGVFKTGDSVTVLTGVNTYTAPTEVKQGTLYVDGSLASHVWVDAGAGFGGNGRVNETVSFRDGSFFDWRFGASESESDLLTASRVDIGNNVWVRPNTSLKVQGDLTNFEGRKILCYDDPLNNFFTGVDNRANPFYDFELDYSEFGWVKISGFLRQEPRALSDIVATSVMMAQTKMYRSAFQQIEREWSSDCPDHPSAGRHIGGQAPKLYRAAWMNFIGRSDQFGSNYFSDQYKFQAYGVQVGFSLFSNCRNSFGIMFGREEGKLANFCDEVRSEDNYLGLYYGHAFDTDLDFRGYVGGGWQTNRLARFSNGYLYRTNYGGGSYNVDLELGRRFLTERQWVLRPFLGLDVAVAQIGKGLETCETNPDSNEYRAYEHSSLTQVLTRVGAELGKSWRLFDFNSGLHFAWNWADTVPQTRIVYPETGGTVMGRGIDIGRFDLVMNVGVNWYITPQRNTMFYLNYIGDLHLDRKGDTGGNTGTVGVVWRF